MTVSPELMKMVERCKLPVTLRYQPLEGFFSWGWYAIHSRDGVWLEPTSLGASRRYLAHRTELESATPSPLVADTAAGCSDASPPEVS